VYAGAGRVSEGISCLQQALTAYESTGIGLLYSRSLMQLGQAYLLANRTEDARACADRALKVARERGERGHEAWAFHLLGDIASHHDRPDRATAEARYAAALALASELGMRALLAHCHLGLGKLYRGTGDQAKAQEHLASAKAMYREMGMSFWLERAEAALGPPHRNSA
jgi:tetratricopeptide (TPR) repeat protein